ncbi:MULTISPECIES: histidine phosphatase family protein [Brachybacterium]|uniref:Fructose 1,6-bisphosphatase n=1 Tax=Brachybacterium alimentarium TaxID=47845 RepID=A0A2A3YI79_9MICO|nr:MULTISPECIES: histidine phosphatase family protein [Brachybacterium]PCC32758.1 fructose 1,6-bisphosphatase [Brachybacterium alimentarium]PCC38981.1 fructose 1,6-bisphosphatase [Brachybacterium alimentarium]RCS63981.1 histidine phosphatase family protein [Brachybacterium sp. JB7]RCS71971.1 histidine phosphatase family protein [Brachybacterium alimentarium]RCS75440.1 histidine phosphatase family protein [Brachybacterium alimentarium]
MKSSHSTGGAVRTRLVLVRHGQTEFNREGRLQGQVDIPLNETGARQAAVLAAAIAENPPDLIVSSPLERARDTARIVGQACELDVTTDEAFLERSFGQWEGLRGEEIRRHWPEEHADWRAHRPVAGLDLEDRPEVAARVAEACRRLAAENTGRTVMVVAHGAAITLGITALLGLDPDGFRGIAGLENCHRSVLEPLVSDTTGQRMRLVSHNLAPDFI